MGNIKQNVPSFYDHKQNNIYSPISTVAHSSMNSFIQKIMIVYLLYAGTLGDTGEAEVNRVDMVPDITKLKFSW